VTDGVTGLVVPVDEPEVWLTGLRRLAADDEFAESLRIAAHRWVAGNFDAHKNAARLLAQFEQAILNPGSTVLTTDAHE
jgi:glycosyltransferase involved in cell wall biosynthesis